jgi:hypothetical protein
MPDYVRVATFEADEAALDAVLAEINSQQGPPEGLPSTGLLVLADRAAGKAVFVARFGSEDDLRQGSETLDSMSPPSEGMRRVSVETYEVVLDRQTP